MGTKQLLQTIIVRLIDVASQGMDKQGLSNSPTLRKRKSNMVPRVKPDAHQPSEPIMKASPSSSKQIGSNGNKSKHLHINSPSGNPNGSVSNSTVAETNLDDVPALPNRKGCRAGVSSSNDAGNSDDDDVTGDADTCQLLPSREEPEEEDDSKVIVEDEVRALVIIYKSMAQ